MKRPTRRPAAWLRHEKRIDLSAEFTQFAIVFACLALGGILKGATGAGTPIIAVPALAMLFDVRFAVVVMLMPNLLTNALQGWQHRADQPSKGFVWIFAIGGGVGAAAGSAILAWFSPRLLSLLVAFAVFVYIGGRLAKPDWKLDFAAAKRIAIHAGFAAGMLQGATGISAPVSITFLSSIRLARPAFIATISIFFTLMTAGQIAALAYLGLLTWRTMVLSFAALVPILAFMPLGAALARRMSSESFDKIILGLLMLLSLKLVWDALTGG